MSKIPENTMTVIKTVFPLLVIVTLFVIVGQFGFGKIVEIRTLVASAESDQKILSQKLDVLRSIAATGVASSNVAVSALPSSNPALAVISQIKILAGTSGLALSEIKAGSPSIDPLGFSNVAITFNITGSRAQEESFLSNIGTFSPITIVERIKLSESSPGSSFASISVKSFFAAFPTKIPAVSDALSDLTPAEGQILKNISGLTQPIFSQIPAATNGGKSDPFSP